MDRLAEELLRSLASGLGSTVMQVAALETCLADVAGEFAGEDPLHPELREGLAFVRADLDELVAAFGESFGELTIPEPSEADVDQLHDLLELAIR